MTRAYELAHKAGVGSPDSPTSPGAKWLEQVADALQEAIDYELGGGTNGDPTTLEDLVDFQDRIAELADEMVPIYTHDRWQIFVDLAAYQFEDELGTDRDDMTERAGIILYQVAETLMHTLFDEMGDE